MDPRHEMIGIVFIGNVKCVRIVGFQNIIRFFFITLSIAAAAVQIPVSGGGGGDDDDDDDDGGGGGGYASLLCGYG